MNRPLVLFLFGFIGFTLMSFFAENASVSLGLMIFILAVIFYFIPTIISSERKTAHFNMILFINLVFGWTVLGWIAALIWTIVEASTKPTVEQQWVEAMVAMHSGHLVSDDEETIPQQKYTW